jgi:hypothetical protein
MKNFPRFFKPTPLLCALAAFALCVLMPTSESIWIDEAQTYLFASEPTFSSWLARLLNHPWSEAFMPVGMFIAWAFEKCLGASEWALRAPNILWGWLGVAAFWRIGRRLDAPWAPLLFAVQPYVWFYANEARPYMLQIGLASILAMFVVEIAATRRLGPRLLILGMAAAWLLAGSTLFGILAVGGVAATAAFLWWRDRFEVRGFIPIAIVFFILFSLLGGYFVRCLSRDAKGAKLWPVGVQNLAISAYELAGFSGLGPPRDEVRDILKTKGAGALVRRIGAAWIPIGLLAAGMIWMAWRLGRKPRSHVDWTVAALALFVLAACVLSTFCLALVAKFPVWGRHLAPAFPFLCLLVVVALRQRDDSALRKGDGVAMALLVACWFGSSSSLRWNQAHRKDDYRAAASHAQIEATQGATVWWIADYEAGRYYIKHLRKDEPTTAGIVHLSVSSPYGKKLETLPKPDVVLMSKPDISDPHAHVREYLGAANWTHRAPFKAFDLWTPQIAPSEASD